MSNTDLINAYFGNEMTDVERQEFETRLQNDPELKREFNFEKEIVDAIKEARRVELKSMLDKVPVSGGSGSTVTTGKVFTALAVTVLVGLGIYLVWPEDQQPVEQNQITMTEPSENTEAEAVEETEVEETEPVKEKAEKETTTEITTEPQPEEVITEEKAVTPEPVIVKPEINTPDIAPNFETSEEMTDSLEAPGSNMASGNYEDHASLDVEIDNTNKNFSFHYQFKSGKLFLYGSFDKGLYEILEINSRGEKTLFLYYKDKFYPLNTNQVKIVPLDPVKDSSLIEKLKKARVEG